MSDTEHTVTLSAEVVTGIEERLPESEFDTVDEYVEFTMGTLLAQLHDEDEAIESEVKDRLESLGYVDE